LKNNIGDKMKEELSSEEKSHYPLVTPKDHEILKKIHEAEKIENLTENEKFFLLLLRTQLERDWRTPLVLILGEMTRNKNLPPEQRWKKTLEKADSSFWKPSIEMDELETEVKQDFYQRDKKQYKGFKKDFRRKYKKL